MNFIRPLDNPGIYIMLMVLGLVIIPFYLKSITRHLSHPEGYYAASLEKKLLIGLVVIAGLILFGILNFLRFIPH